MNGHIKLQLRFLGRAEIWVDGALLTAGVQWKGLALLAYLAVTGQRQSREALAGLLWGEMPEAAARANLRVTLNRLPASIRPFLAHDPHTLALLPQPGLWVDVKQLETAAMQNRSAWETAVDLYRGDFLHSLTIPQAPAFEEWVLLERERLRLRLIDLLHHLSQEALEQHQYEQGIVYTRRILALDSWREETHRLLMHLLVLNGRRSEALTQFETCRRLLAENLGVAPTAETITLYESIKQDDHPTLLQTAPHHLPIMAASFVGRERELTQLSGLLAQPDGRLFTILGPGGVGKSRLAIETAVRHLGNGRFRDGIFFIPLTDIPAETNIVPVVAEAVGLKLTAATSPETQLLQHLRPRHVLLVLDNFEHLLPQVDLVSHLLTLPHVYLLVTSRERLNLYEEWLFEVNGLSLPPEAAADWAVYDAPQLFIQRARRVYLGLDATAERAAIQHICHLVEGLPLALELAAARVRTLPCREIARLLEENLALLSSTLRNVPERQRSLWATVNSSWQLLETTEQQVLARLAVFRGGFAGEAATTITGGMMRHLSVLVDKSLLQRQPDGRYRLHEVIRSFAITQLSDTEWQQLRASHTRYYAQFLATQGNKSNGPAAETTFQATALELENGRFAWSWAVAQLPDAETVHLLQQSLPHLSHFYLRRGRSHEAASWLAETLPQVVPFLSVEDPQSPINHLCACLHHQLAKQEEALGQYRQAQQRLLFCLPLLETSPEVASAADAWEILGRTQRQLGDVGAAETSFQRSLVLYRATEQVLNMAGVLNSLGVLAKNNGRYAEATAYYSESLGIFRQWGDRSGVAVSLINLGNIANVQGAYAQARVCYEESYELAVAAEDRSQMAINQLNLGSVARAMGDVAAAEQYYRRSLALGQEMERKLIVAAAFDGLGQTFVLQGDWETAQTQLRLALETAVSLQAQNMILTVLASIVQFLYSTGQPASQTLLHLVMGHPNTAHYVKEELTAFATRQGIDLTQKTTAIFTLDEGVQLAMGYVSLRLAEKTTFRV